MNAARILLNISRRIPDCVAVEDRSGSTTFGEFTDRMTRMAGGIREGFGLVPGDRVVVFLESCATFLDIIYACWTAGLCVVPVNSKLHVQEVAHIIRNSGAGLCFTSADKASELGAAASGIPHLRSILSTGEIKYLHLHDGDRIAVHDSHPTDPAWIFYTSGTTGKPKGATLTFRNLLFMAHCYYADIDQPVTGDTMLHAAPLSHGSGLYSLPHIFRGGRQVILGGFDPEAIFAAIARYPNVVMFAAPTMISRLLDSPTAQDADLANLKVLCFGGGPMYVSELKRALERFGDRLYHVYGQGESPMTITGYWPRRSDAGSHSESNERLASCGFARTGVEFGIVDPEGRPLPNGEIGEVVSRSDCVMTGYWQNPDATANTIRNGWLCTGDIGAVDDAGYLYLKDRSKDLIISGGTNIYPREIEDVLLTHPDIKECSVVGKPNSEWGEEVCAFVVMRDGASLKVAELDSLVVSNIARFKRPKSYRSMEYLPKNNYGKVLKTELRKILSES